MTIASKAIRWIVVAACLMPVAALPQTQTQTQTPADPRDVRSMGPQSTTDPPLGFPYNTGGNADLPATAQVPLRDFLSSRQDQQRAELIERIESLSRHMQQIIDERDRQYAQRFAAQQDAMDAALVSAQGAVSSALAAAKEAVTKAEVATEKRFDSVNEFRAALSDQTANFVSKSTAEARFASLEEKVNSVYDRLNALQAQGQGSADTWGWIVGLGGLAIAVIAFLYSNANRGRRDRAT